MGVQSRKKCKCVSVNPINDKITSDAFICYEYAQIILEREQEEKKSSTK